MKLQSPSIKLSLFAAAAATLMAIAMPASAHCDGVDGPVVQAAQQALDSGNVNRVLIWVQPAHEAEIRNTFDKTLQVRKLNATAKDVADHAFFDTLVRVHRAGEGEPYTGLKPAGRDLGPALPAADRALVSGSVEPVVQLLSEGVHRGIEQRYQEAMALRDYKVDDVAAGQKYVQAYVSYIHAVEQMHAAGASDAHAHAAAPAAHRHD